MEFRTRFAPSPTGYIHLGNGRTAILNALAVQQQSGSDRKFLLRIEDTDVKRSEEKYISAVCHDLNNLNISWQEGEQVGGPYAPYRQSGRLDIYQTYFHTLLNNNIAYPCFCTENDLVKMRREQKLSGEPPRYDKRCSRLDKSVQEKHLKEGKEHVLRFNTTLGFDKNAEIIFNDLVKGKQRFPRHDISDFIIRKADGLPTFFFSNAVDDSIMNVTHVLRGDDHLTNTPRQIMLLEALDLALPKYGHLSTIVGEDGTPLSKRNGSRSIKDLLEEGWLPLAIVNYLARLGHYYANDSLLTVAELGRGFSFDNLGKSAAKFDWSMFKHWQRKALISLDSQQLWAWLSSEKLIDIPHHHQEIFAKTIAQNILLPHEAGQYAQLIYQKLPAFTDNQTTIVREAGSQFFSTALDALEKQLSYKEITQSIQKTTGKKGKQLFQPLRIALTAMEHGPDMDSLLQLIPQNIAKERLQYWV